MPKLAYRSPLAAAVEPLGIVGLTVEGLRIVEKPFTTLFELRGDGNDPGFRDAVRGAVGLDLPIAACTSATGAEARLLWLEPDGWLLAAAPQCARRLADSLLIFSHAVTEVSHRSVGFELSGPKSRDFLARGCPLDLHEQSFPVGRVARSLLAGQPVIVHSTGDSPSFDLYVDQSLARYFWSWMQDAAGAINQNS